MGIDAEMFVRVRGRDNWLTEEQVLRKAWELGTTFGHQRFMILTNKDYGAPRHCLHIVEPFVDEYGEAPDMVGKRVIFQDAPPIIANDDEQFLRLHLFTRYYGPGYERGDWPLIRGIAEWCELNIPHGEVWYGGDSSGVAHERFDIEARAKFNEHFLREGHRPYEGYFGRGETAPRCPLCKEPTFYHGGGGGPRSSAGSYSLFRCGGCGQQCVQSDARTEWYGAREENAMGKFNGAVA